MQILRMKFQWTIPNVLSLVRIALVPVFAVLYLLKLDIWAFVVLVVSGVTDVLDGFIARKLDQITEWGKILDPVGDKLTQLTVVVCLATRYYQLFLLVLICLSKEVLQAIGGLLLMKQEDTMTGAKWFGKLSTVLFYCSMAAIVLWNEVKPPMPQPVFWTLVGAVALTMLFAFFNYLNMYIQHRRMNREIDAGVEEEMPPTTV